MNPSRIYLMLMLLGFAIGCGGGGGSKENSYAKLISQASASFTSGNYTDALNAFNSAKSADPNSSVPYSGAGWCYILLDNASASLSEFTQGSTKQSPGADLFAGWGLVLNILDDYAGSNTKLDQALSTDAQWQFSLGLGMDKDDIHLTKAENYFLLGSYAESKAEVLILNTSFTGDVTTQDGRAQLAAEIERLKALTKRRLNFSANILDVRSAEYLIFLKEDL